MADMGHLAALLSSVVQPDTRRALSGIITSHLEQGRMQQQRGGRSGDSGRGGRGVQPAGGGEGGGEEGAAFVVRAQDGFCRRGAPSEAEGG